jgi:hypothetical protein
MPVIDTSVRLRAREPAPPNTRARKVTRSIYEAARDRARETGARDADVISRRERKNVERLFAHLKRIPKVNCGSAAPETDFSRRQRSEPAQTRQARPGARPQWPERPLRQRASKAAATRPCFFHAIRHQRMVGRGRKVDIERL